uniref:WAP domain-containing protein n=1 Tax=Sinocyclocheilus anshuiensis TaxID=1608454 RepID=A0A671L6X3_9TELE
MAPYKVISVDLYCDLVSVSCVCITEKPGVCPSRSLRIGVCAEMCSHDCDCPNNQKCCSNGCGHQCMPPYRGMLYWCHARVYLFIFLNEVPEFGP